MASFQGRTVPAKTVVLSKDGSELFSVNVDGFLHLVKQGVVRVHGSARKIHRLQLTVEPAQASLEELAVDPTYGKKYTREEHVDGRYYIHQLKHIPRRLAADFRSVLDSVTVSV